MSLNEFETKLLANIDEHGWQANYVFDDKEVAPSFTYSIGFSKSLNSAEFIVFGLDKDLMHNMLWEVFHQIKSGTEPKDGMRWQGLLDGFKCVSKKANHPELFTEYTVSANWLWKHLGREGHPEIYQLIWPGAQQGLFPWEDGCDPYVVSQQPALW